VFDTVSRLSIDDEANLFCLLPFIHLTFHTMSAIRVPLTLARTLRPSVIPRALSILPSTRLLSTSSPLSFPPSPTTNLASSAGSGQGGKSEKEAARKQKEQAKKEKEKERVRKEKERSKLLKEREKAKAQKEKDKANKEKEKLKLAKEKEKAKSGQLNLCSSGFVEPCTDSAFAIVNSRQGES